ncbi:neutral alpha-glucosidase ab precursor, putative [Entamoeba invadens IP1]|uniref:Neutral alpha-glucosidase ab, putative n=1 Tax=Entamoeba invadens IP1 TaxID=370355 RepID=A0A0A1UF12_ENTIV|nr:neutral alpha-glucosidase ab precursor, putative [Entamoeba invadens IP1]ELP91381.1 neutral alpha-glucosidase ab precursor, putative [Entamoeba invadens IP1]|eukprot:XP_004258152.1 neutral alpha-glucosidase ab precursor, putative [Entamoeba invadens IP1]
MEKMSSTAPFLSLWLDYSEPSSYYSNEMTIFRDAIHQFHEHRELHNAYPNLHAESVFKGLQRNSMNSYYKNIPFILSTGFYSGIQQYGGVILSQSSSSWEGLQFVIKEALSMSISGVSFVGSDIGGYYDMSTLQVYLRWLQASTFLPLFRGYSEMHTFRKEPYMFKNNRELVKYAFEIRNMFLRFWNSKFIECHINEVPVIRPLFYNFPDDENSLLIEGEWMVSTEILVSGVYDDSERCQVYLPKGLWFNFFSDEIIQSNASYIEMEIDYEFIPVFVRGGSVLVIGDRKCLTVEECFMKHNELHFYLGDDGNATTLFYASCGEREGERIVRLELKGNQNTIEGRVQEIYTCEECKKVQLFVRKIVIHNMNTKPKHVHSKEVHIIQIKHFKNKKMVLYIKTFDAIQNFIIKFSY